MKSQDAEEVSMVIFCYPRNKQSQLQFTAKSSCPPLGRDLTKSVSRGGGNNLSGNIWPNKYEMSSSHNRDEERESPRSLLYT